MTAMAMTQQEFASALLDPAQLPTGLRVVAGIDSARRFDVHRNNVMVTLVDAMAVAFPVTQALVGEEFFAAMARERLRIDPPRSPIIVDYGDGFAEFIASYAPAACVPYLADMARLERLRGQAYHAADAPGLAAPDYAALLATPERLAAARLRLLPACRWMSSRHAVRSLWAAHQHPDAERDVALAAVDVDAAEDVLVTRPHWEVRLVALPDGGIVWLEALRDGLSIGAALARAIEASPAARADLLFALLLQHGLATTFEFAQEH